MATCNFIDNPAPFPIYAMSGEDLEVWTCPYCDVVLERDGEGWTCPDCGCHTRYPDQDACTRDEWLEHMRVEDLADELEAAVDDFAPLFYRVELRPGYYEGVQIAVTLEDDPRDMDEDDARGLWGLGRSAAVRALDSETARLRAMLDRWAAGFGFTPLAVFARFSSGETWYAPVDTDERRAA